MSAFFLVSAERSLAVTLETGSDGFGNAAEAVDYRSMGTIMRTHVRFVQCDTPEESEQRAEPSVSTGER
jgi:hypothetical protein